VGPTSHRTDASRRTLQSYAGTAAGQLKSPCPRQIKCPSRLESRRLGDTGKTNLVLVTQRFFKTNTNGIDASKVSDDVLGFCSLVLSYTKGAIHNLKVDASPKLMLTFMPRTGFNTMYQQVKSKLPGDLFALFDSLACYKTVYKAGRPAAGVG
jgi:hypothetical protein